MFETILTLLFLLIAGHAIGDFAIQTDWVAYNKNRHMKENISRESQGKIEFVWPWVLSAHALHHGLIVFLITQKIWLGVAETVVHWVTDYGKSENWYGFHTDQALHVVAKFVWVGLLYYQIV
jgi:hypothetical protein